MIQNFTDSNTSFRNVLVSLFFSKTYRRKREPRAQGGSTSVLRAECFGSVAHNRIKRGKFPDSIHFYSVYVSKKLASQTQTELVLKKSYTADCQQGYVYEATFFPSLFYFVVFFLGGAFVCLLSLFVKGVLSSLLHPMWLRMTHFMPFTF